MPVVRLEGVSFAHRDSVPILVDVSLELHPGWTAVVGANGAGKTTLLGLIAGALAPDAGAVRLEPPGATRRWCRQTADALTDEIRALAASREGTARRWLGQLALEPAQLARWPALSPGERRRWQVAAALADEPAVLLLDEPTDHLDADARTQLVAALAAFRGVGVLVSHDRALLAALATATARVVDGRVELRRTGFEEARRAWRMENEERRSTRTRIRREDERLRRSLGRRRNDLASADARIRTVRRARGRKDRDQRSMAARNRARSGAARAARNVARLRGRVQSTSGALASTRFEKERGGPIDLRFEPAPGEHIASLCERVLRAGERPLLRDVSLEVRRGTRAWLRGANGAGKSTLLRALLARTGLPGERLLHLPQELEPGAQAALLDDVRRLGTEERGALLGVAATLGADPERLLASEAPSPGEARKLWIAAGLARGVAVCFLDEPTNHLDLPAIERLEAALAAYPGALVLVSHDEPLARACTHETWTVAGGTVTVE